MIVHVKMPGHFVRVLLFRQDDDLCYPIASGVQGHPALGALVDLAAPSVDGLDRSEVVRAGADPLFDELAAEVLQPARVGGRYDDLA